MCCTSGISFQLYSAMNKKDNKKMEMKKIAKHKTLWKMNSTSEPLLITGVEDHSLKKFTIPKIRRTSRKVYLSPCFTNTREYSFIHGTLTQCRLDLSCDLQSLWQFGDTKLVHNEDLEKNFTSKRSEMRENGRHGRELEEHFCFLALPQSDVAEIYYNGISSKASTLKILGNPLLGIYIFRHVDVALNYAHSRSINVESIIVFKVLFGKVKKIQPLVDKNKVSLDPSPNFDCHMSRNTPSPKDTIELQAYNSAVYFYEYNVFSNPVDKPRQCLPYAIVTVKFIGQKVGNGHLMTSLRFLSTGFPKRAERTCCLNNCTVAKRIGKGKDATIIFEHFRKPVDPLVQENCSCSALSSDISSSNSNISNSCENVQNGNISIIETHSGQMKHNLTQCRDTSQVQADDSGLSFIPSDAKENVNGDLLNWTHLKNVLSGLPATFPFHNNVGSSTVITSKFIKDPRLMRREESVEKHNNTTGLNNILPFKKNLDFVNSGINLTMPTNSASSSKVMPSDDAILTNCLDAPCFKISFDDSQAQTHNMGSQDCGYYTTPNTITMAGQCQDQDNFSFPMCVLKGVPEVKNQKHSAEKAQRSQQRSNIPLLIEQNSEPHNSCESVNTYTKGYDNHISQESQSSSLRTTCQTNHQMSAVFQFQKEKSIHEYIQNIGKVRNFTGLEDGSKHIAKQNLWEKIDNYHTNETKISPANNSISLHQEYKEDESLNYLGGRCDQRLIPQELEISKSSTSTTNYKYELDYPALELQNNLTPRVEGLSQKYPQHCLENEDDIYRNFAISQKLTELKLERTSQNGVSIITDAFQEAKDISHVKNLPMDVVISSHDIKTAHDNSNCSIAREHTCINRKNKNDAMLLERIQREFGTSQVDDKGQGHTLFCNAQLNNDIHLTVNFKEQRDDRENQSEVKGKDIASSTENNIENICGDEVQGFHTNKSFTTDERWENNNYNNVEILSCEEFTTFNLPPGKKYVSAETTLLGTEDTLTAIKQKDTQNTVRSVKHPNSCKISGSLGHVASNATLQINSTMVPTLETDGDHQRHKFKQTCSSESPDLGLVKHKVSDYEMHMDKNKLYNSFQKSSDNVVLQSIELESEIEVEAEECDDVFPPQQDTHRPRNTLYEEFGSIYEELKSRIDWESLLGSSNGEKEVLTSTTREHSDQHYSDYASTQKNKAELFNTILLPDLQIRITNTLRPGISSTVKSFSLKDNICKYITEPTKPEINEEVGKVPGFEIYSQCCGNSCYSFEDEFGNIKQESGMVSESEISLSIDFSDNTHVNHMSKEQSSGPWLTEPSSVTINNASRCSLTNSKIICNDMRSKKDTESRISKRKLHTPFRDQSLPHHEICEKKRRLTDQDSSECFSSLSEGRIKTFSQSEKHIRSVLDILNSEVSLCKSKCLSKKLDRALLYLKKAHRRVNTSLELIAKVGETRKGPLPKSYEIICNNFWEICDLQGYGSVSERRYYSTKHFFPKRKYDKPGEKRALGFEVNKSLTPVSKYQFDRTSEERTTKCFSKKNVANGVSRSHSTLHMGEFCDQEYPESQLTLGSTSQSTSQSTYNNIYMKNPESSRLQPFSGKMGCLLFPDCPDEKVTKKEHQVEIKSLSNINKYEKPEKHLAHNNEDAVKEGAETNEVINKTNSVSLSCIKENNLSFSADENCDATCIAHTKVKTDIVISVLESDAKHFLNVDNYKPDNLISPGYKRNLEVNFLQKWTSSSKNSTPGTLTGNVHLDPLHQTLITSKKCNTLPQLAAAPVTDNERESKKTCLDEQRAFATDSFSTSTNVPHHQQECSRKELLKTEQCYPSSCVHIDRNETHVIENSELDLVPVTEESKSYKENTMKRLFFSDSSLLLKDDMKGSSKKCILEKNIPDRKMWKIKQTEKAKDSVHKTSITKRSSVKNEYRNQKNKILADDAYISEKTIKNNLIDSHQSIKNITEVISLNNTASNQLNDRKKEGRVKVSIDSQSDSTLHSELACNFKPDILGVNHMPFLRAHSETSKVSTPQKNPTLYMNKLKEKHCSANHSGLIARLAQILKRADEASSLQRLQEETKVCQSILPLFVEAFEKKQECSLEQILISRELLVEKNLWDNCKHKLKPCAVDSLVELQMMMETIQFIENKKRLLGGEPTFRSLLWYDETLYSELLGRPRGFQQQSNFYPAFQGRLKYNAFCELQNYHDQLIELLGDTKKENNSYYAFLKCKRQIKECEAILRHCSDCFDFTLSVPFTCGVNFGDSLGDLETLRKSTLKLISMYGDSPKVDSYPGKRDHLWIIIEMISSKVNFIKSSEAVGINISLFGLEHIFFDAAKSLIWKEKKQSFSKKYSGQKNKGTLLKMNQHSFSKLQEIYDTLSKDLSSEQISNTGFEENTVMASRKSDDLINKPKINTENCRLNSTSISHPDICCVSEILDQAKFADFKTLQELTLRCTDHLEVLKKYFQMLQEDNRDDIFITEGNVLDVLENYNHEAVILKPAATETYIEMAMLSETVHFLKNSMAKKLDKPRFRGMLWFDLSLLPELIHCQEKMASFSFLKDNSTDHLWKVIETVISELKKDLDVTYKYDEAINCSYALRLFSRELEELSEIKKLLKKSKYSISTYIDFVPCIASINYGSTMTQLEYNYNQFSTLLKNLLAASRKDLGKMAHTVRVMKTIEYMKIVCAKNAELTLSFILCQMLHNRENTFQLKVDEKMNVHVKPRRNVNKSSTCMTVPSISECTIKNVSNSSKKRRITLDQPQDSQEQEKNTTVSCCKKQKVNEKGVTKISREKAAFKHPRTTRSHPENESEIGPSSSGNLKRNYGSPKKVEMQRSLPASPLPLKNLKDTCMLKSEGKIDLTNISSDTSEEFTGHQEKVNSMKKRNVNFSTAETKSDKKDCSSFAICDPESVHGTFSKDHETPSQKKLLNNSPDPSDMKPGTDATFLSNALVPSKPIFCLVSDIHANLEMNGTVFELQDNETLNSSIKNCTGTKSPEPIFIQNKIPLQEINETQPAKSESKEKYVKDTLNPSTVPVETSENITLNVNQTAEPKINKNSFSEQKKNKNSKVLTQNAATHCSELAQAACAPICNSSEHAFGTVSPSCAWYVYHYLSSNGSFITQTYQGITSFEVQPPPSEIFTAVPSTVQNIHSNLLFSQYFGYFPGDPRAYGLMPANRYFPSQMPVSSSVQQPAFSHCASYQLLPQAAYPHPPDLGVLPQVLWTYVPWQHQELFHPGH